MATTYLLTGSNLGESLTFIQSAKSNIEAQIGKVSKASSVFKTAPWGNLNQPPFLNQVLQCETDFTPYQLIQHVLDIETAMGRTRQHKWEARIIDIDILFYDDIILTGNLNIPHPLLHLRRFVLEPLNEIAPYLIHPQLQKNISELLKDCPDKGIVEKM